MTAYLEVRTQSARGQWPSQGPGMYVAVQIVPEGVERLKVLRHDVAAKRGIEIRWIGEGYYNRTGPRSSLGIAVAAGEELVAQLNGKQTDAN